MCSKSVGPHRDVGRQGQPTNCDTSSIPGVNLIGSARRFVGAVTACCLFSAIVAISIPASAVASTRGTGATCATTALTEPFARWSDDNLYELAPGGDFESSLSGWVLKGGAQRVSGSETFGVTGKVGSYSLQIPRGGVAVSPSTCINAAYPAFRLFTRTSTPGTKLNVSVVYPTGKTAVTMQVATLSPGSTWQPTSPVSTGSMLGQLLDGPTANLSIEFATTQGSAQIDDIFIDPHGRCC